MRLFDAEKAISKAQVKGYCVSFEHISGGMLMSDHYPDVRQGEEPFFDKAKAIESGEKFAEATKGKTCNFYLIDYRRFTPVEGWSLKNR